jgi:50S ribosomal protein L16 3-hydroxylase
MDWVSFIPRWRMDDIMVSIAAPGGGVGPHRDQYDVFLIQTQGERHWQVSAPNQDVDILCGDELLQVPPFIGEIDEVLSCGDVLYIPPGWRHWGVAKDLCVTVSIGFRAPSAEELMLSLSDQLSTRTTKRFSDPWRKPNSGESISLNDVAEVRTKIASILEDDQLLAEALGLQVTLPKLEIAVVEEQQNQFITEQIMNDSMCIFSLDPISRMSYFLNGEVLTTFANGLTLDTQLDKSCESFIENMCKHQACSLSSFQFDHETEISVKQLLNELIQLDAIILEE